MLILLVVDILLDLTIWLRCWRPKTKYRKNFHTMFKFVAKV